MNDGVPGLKDRARWDPLFYAAIYPAVVREILGRAIDEDVEIDEVSDRWPVLWLRFGKNLHPDRETPPKHDDTDEDRHDWIESVVEAFCRDSTP